MIRDEQESFTPRVSVITVTYNLISSGRVNFFEDCLKSVQQQDYLNFEHLVIDGGSSDGTVELLKKYENLGWIKYISERDSGVYDAMNKGIRLAEGEYINFLNSDDHFCCSTAISSSMDAILRHGADMSCSKAYVIDEYSGERIAEWNQGWDSLFFGECPNHQTVFCRKSVLEEIGGFCSEAIAKDFISFLLIYALGKKVIRNDQFIVNFRCGGLSSNSNYNNQKNLDEIKSYIYSLFAQRYGISPSEYDQVYHYKYLKKPTSSLISIGSRIENLAWKERFFENISVFPSRRYPIVWMLRKRDCFLFGILSMRLVKIFKKEGQLRVSVFGIRIR